MWGAGDTRAGLQNNLLNCSIGGFGHFTATTGRSRSFCSFGNRVRFLVEKRGQMSYWKRSLWVMGVPSEGYGLVFHL